MVYVERTEDEKYRKEREKDRIKRKRVREREMIIKRVCGEKDQMRGGGGEEVWRGEREGGGSREGVGRDRRSERDRHWGEKERARYTRGGGRGRANTEDRGRGQKGGGKHWERREVGKHGVGETEGLSWSGEQEREGQKEEREKDRCTRGWGRKRTEQKKKLCIVYCIAHQRKFLFSGKQ